MAAWESFARLVSWQRCTCRGRAVCALSVCWGRRHWEPSIMESGWNPAPAGGRLWRTERLLLGWGVSLYQKTRLLFNGSNRAVHSGRFSGGLVFQLSAQLPQKQLRLLKYPQRASGCRMKGFYTVLFCFFTCPRLFILQLCPSTKTSTLRVCVYKAQTWDQSWMKMKRVGVAHKGLDVDSLRRCLMLRLPFQRLLWRVLTHKSNVKWGSPSLCTTRARGSLWVLLCFDWFNAESPVNRCHREEWWS